MSKSVNPEKGKTLSFEISPQLFWTIFTAVIGVTFFLAFTFGQQSSAKDLAAKQTQITTIAADTQNVYKRLLDSLHIRVTLLDTRTDSKRVSQLRSSLREFNFVTTDRFGIDDSLDENIKLKPDILIAHWHTYRTDGNDAHDTVSENQLLNTIERYAKINPAIRVIIFSSVFADKNERERLTSKKIAGLQQPVSAYPLHGDSENEITTIIAKALSISVEKISGFTH